MHQLSTTLLGERNRERDAKRKVWLNGRVALIGREVAFVSRNAEALSIMRTDRYHDTLQSVARVRACACGRRLACQTANSRRLPTDLPPLECNAPPRLVQQLRDVNHLAYGRRARVDADAI